MTSTKPDSVDDYTPNPKHIPNPRRLLILTPTSQSLSTIPPLLHSLTGVPVHDPPQREIETDVVREQEESELSQSHPSELATTTATSFAGYTTHSPLRLETKYYTAEIPVWVDEIPIPIPGDLSAETEKGKVESDTETIPTSTQWRTEFLSDEAQIVREAVGAIVVCVKSPEASPSLGSGSTAKGLENNPAERGDVRKVRDLMRDVGAVKGCIDEERGGMGDIPGVLVLVGPRRSAAIASSGLGEGSGGLDLGGDEDGLGDGIEDLPFSMTWWEDLLFDMGLFGWEVVEWDPAELGGEKTRNRFGGIYSCLVSWIVFELIWLMGY